MNLPAPPKPPPPEPPPLPEPSPRPNIGECCAELLAAADDLRRVSARLERVNAATYRDQSD